MLAPVYLTYRTYQVFLGRIEDQRRHVEETQKLHSETVEALLQARRAERALADEKERLAVTLRSIGDGVITTDLDGNVLSINNVAEATDRLDPGGGRREAVRRGVPELRSRDPASGGDNSVAKWRGTPGSPASRTVTVLVARDLVRASDRRDFRAASRCRRPHDRDGRGVPRYHRRAQDARGAGQGEQARLARAAGRRHRPRLQQHPDGRHGQRLDGARDDAGRSGDAGARRGSTSLCPRAATDVAAPDVLQRRSARSRRPSRSPASSRSRPASRSADPTRAARSTSRRSSGPCRPTRGSSCRCSPT